MLPGLRWAVPVAALGVGVALGAWGMRWRFDETVGRWDPQERLVEQWTERLGLDARQRTQVAGILSEEKGRMEGRRLLWERDARDLEREGEASVEAVLRDDQRDRFLAQREALHAQMERYLWSTETYDAVAAGPRP